MTGRENEPPPPDVLPPVASLRGLVHRYGPVRAVDGVSLDIPAGGMAGFIGPDGVGKSTLLGLVAGARRLQEGSVRVLGGEMADRAHREALTPRIAYMPQGLGRNLYPTLSVFENIDFFGRLFGQPRKEREQRIEGLLAGTGMSAFADRQARKLSGGMKQKLGLCCALVHDPDLLILDEPTTGVDPLSRRQFWELIGSIRANRRHMSVLVATAYMEEAGRFDWLAAMDRGKVLAVGSPAELLERTGAASLESAFLALLPPERLGGHRELAVPPLDPGEVVIEAKGLQMRFGDFTAVDDVNLEVRRGEIFGFLGSNGCGKSTTMRMLTGLQQPTRGTALLLDRPVDAKNMETRRRVGYMSQSFSLYGELTVLQNLELHARLFHLPKDQAGRRIDELAERFELTRMLHSLPGDMPLGLRQRLQLAVAVLHAPDVLILDEPTSGVDPVARDRFWEMIIGLSRNDRVTIFISTHFMNEAQRCDRISLMHAGRILDCDSPRALVQRSGEQSLEDAFIARLEQAAGLSAGTSGPAPAPSMPASAPERLRPAAFSPTRLWSFSHRELLELRRDPVRLSLALLGSLLLMLVMGYGLTMDVENLSYAVLDLDNSTASQAYTLNFLGSRYFSEQKPLESHADLDKRMREGGLAMALEIPPGFGRDLARGAKPEVGVWLDGAMPMRGEVARGYVAGLHTAALAGESGQSTAPARIEVRYRYNPELKSIIAMVPAVIPLLLVFIPAMLTALGVVREKELGSILNVYTTPVTRLEFLVGKQLPYIGLSMVSFALMYLAALALFQVPFKGSLATLCLGALLYVTATTGLGLLTSTLIDSQVAAIGAASIATLLPAIQFSGLMDPVSTLEGFGALVGTVYPTAHFLTISRGTFSKALGFSDLTGSFLPLMIAIPVLTAASAALLRKQAR